MAKHPPRAQGFLSVLSDPGPHWLAPSDYLNEVEDPETLTLGFPNSQTAKMTSLTSTFFFFFFLAALHSMQEFSSPVETRNLNQWTTREVPTFLLKKALPLTKSFPGGSDGNGKIPWRRKWQPTPILLPGKFHGWSILVGYSPWGCKESDTTERLHFDQTFIRFL